MRIHRNVKRERELFEKVRAALETDREGIHASDLLSPRLSFFRKLFPVPLTADEVGYFMTGHGHHMALVHIDTGKKGESQEESRYSEEYGITYSPDLLASAAEFKTARYPDIPKTEAQSIKTFSRYAQQCLIYAICEERDTWHLYVLFIGLRKRGPDGKYVGGLKAPLPQCYTIVWDEDELEEGREWIREQVDLLKTAFETKDASALPLCEEWQCMRWNPETRQTELTCPYFLTHCKPEGRYERYMEGKKLRKKQVEAE